MAAMAAAVQFKRVQQLAPTQTPIPDGFDQRAQQLTAAASLVRRTQREASHIAETGGSSSGGDLCFNLQPQTRRSQIVQQQQQQQLHKQQTKTAKIPAPAIVRGTSVCPGTSKFRSNCATPPAGESQQTTTSNKLTTTTTTKSPPLTPSSKSSPAPTITTNPATVTTTATNGQQLQQCNNNRPTTSTTATFKSASSKSSSISSNSSGKGPQAVAVVHHEIGSSGSNLRHSWRSSTSSLNCAHLATVRSSRRRLVVSSTKSLLQLNTLTATTTTTPNNKLPQSHRAAHRQSQDCSYNNLSNQHHRQLARAGSLAVVSEPLESYADTLSATKLNINHHNLHRHGALSATKTTPEPLPSSRATTTRQTTPPRRASQAPLKQPSSIAKASSVAPSVVRVALLASKRALSCNQLSASAKPDRVLPNKVGDKSSPGSAITNSRLRQGALFARRQCQLASRLSLVDSTSQQQQQQGSRRPLASNGSKTKTSTTTTTTTRTTTTTTTTTTTKLTSQASSRSRPPHLTRRDTRNQQQQEAYKLTRLAQVHRARAACKTAGKTKTTTIATKTTNKTISGPSSCSIRTPSSPVSAAAIIGKDLGTTGSSHHSHSHSHHHHHHISPPPTIGRRRWSSLESSNNDDSSPSSSSSTLSTNSSLLIQAALADYHTNLSSVSGTGGGDATTDRELQVEESGGDQEEALVFSGWQQQRHNTDSSSSSPLLQLKGQTSALALHDSVSEQTHAQKANDKDNGAGHCTRQPAEKGQQHLQQQQQKKAQSDETLGDHDDTPCQIDASRTQQLSPNNSDNLEPKSNCLSCDRNIINTTTNNNSIERQHDQAACFRQLSTDLADIVVKQPDHLSFITSLSSSSSSSDSHNNNDDDLIGVLLVDEQQQHHQQSATDNCHGKRINSMVLIEQQQQQRKPPVGQELKSHNHTTTNNLNEFRSNEINGEKLSDASGDNSNFITCSSSLGALPEINANGAFTGKMMISAGTSDNNETSHRERPCCDDQVKEHNQDQDSVRLDKSGQHQPLGLLQTINIEQRQQQSKESSVGKPQELTKAVISKQQQPQQQQQQKAQQKTDLIPIKQEPICDYYDLEPRPFARGKFAQVKRCLRKDTKECFAAKCIKKRRRLVDIRHEILLEIEALKLSYHTDYIVKLYEVFETPNEMILILEMANGGELQRVLDDEESISESLVRKMVRQILEGLVHLHDDQIVHLDIKPQNLLLTKPFPNGDIKLCDFGISRRITECEIRDICGTPDYTAPEVLQYDPISLNTDMWSLGVVTYVLLSGYSPFGSENKQQTFCNITTCSLDFPPELFDGISENAIDFVKKLIVLEPSQRLTSRQALLHPWFN